MIFLTRIISSARVIFLSTVDADFNCKSYLDSSPKDISTLQLFDSRLRSSRFQLKSYLDSSVKDIVQRLFNSPTLYSLVFPMRKLYGNDRKILPLLIDGGRGNIGDRGKMRDYYEPSSPGPRRKYRLKERT